MRPTSCAAETLLHLSSLATGPDGSRYEARACGAPMPDGCWEGWIEFVPIAGGEPVRTSRETTQPNRTDTEYWASGLTPVYLDGALNRALREPRRVAFDSPPRESIIDPFSVYANGEFHLRKQLNAMAAWHLVNIARDYELTAADVGALNRMSSHELIELVKTTTRKGRRRS